MRLALSILLTIVMVGILVHGYLSRIRPFDILLQSIRLVPKFVREKPLIALTAVAVSALTPLAPLIAGAMFSSPVYRPVGALVWQALCTAVLALVAVRIHRGVVLRDKAMFLRFGPIERRMLNAVMAAWCLVVCVSLTPWLAGFFGPRLVERAVVFFSPIVVSLVLVLLAYIGPAASLGDESPFSRSLQSAREQFTATAALVLTLRGLLELTAIAVEASLVLGGANALIVFLALPVIILASAFVFILTEVSIVIALTRIWENRYDDTRSREHNADWH